MINFIVELPLIWNDEYWNLMTGNSGKLLRINPLHFVLQESKNHICEYFMYCNWPQYINHEWFIIKLDKFSLLSSEYVISSKSSISSSRKFTTL